MTNSSSVTSKLSEINVSNQSTDPNPFTQLILDFRGKNLPSEQIEADHNKQMTTPHGSIR